MTNLEWTVGPDDQGLRLDKFLAANGRLGSRARAAAALGRGKVFVNRRETGIADAGTPVAVGDIVRVWMDRPGSARRRPRAAESPDFRIIYEDEALLVLNKPAGLLAVPLPRRSGAPSVLDQLEDHLASRGERRPFVVHRIDRDTSGLVVFAKYAGAQERLKEQFKRREAERVYVAIVHGQPRPPTGIWRDSLVWDQTALIQKKARPGDPRAKEAISEYQVMESFPGASLVEVRLVSGKRNQIRIQARLHGHPVVGDRRYTSRPDELLQVEFPRQALHAHRLAFRHPADGRELRFEASLPADLKELLARLRRLKRNRRS
jgi:23S rRNA pseudouridine1911/1915/1917 synthase